MNSIDASALNGRPRPRARILQWGEGNFLRAFVDWKIDRMNEAGGLDWGVVIVRPIAEGNPHWLNEQDGLYTVLSRGVADDGAKVSDARVVGSVLKEIGAHQHWDEVLRNAQEAIAHAEEQVRAARRRFDEYAASHAAAAADYEAAATAAGEY